ncbi:MAG: hypothetical protein IJI54_04695 [Kiritimatiellae bacterium]|nr:hypothetical protein [Kiritimatiellia bacterium]
MSYKLLKNDRDALPRVRAGQGGRLSPAAAIGRFALVAAAVCVATYPPNGASRASGR